MAGGHGPGDLRPRNDQKFGSLGSLQGQFIASVPVGMWDIQKVRLVFYVIRNGDYIQSIFQSFLDPYIWPDIPVGKHRVHVQVTLKGHIARYIRKFYGTGVFLGFLCLSRGSN